MRWGCEMQAVLEVIKEPQDEAILTMYEARLGLNMSSSSTFQDDQLDMLIKWSSGEIAISCSRVFAKQTVQETFRDFHDYKRLPLGAYPIVQVTSVVENGVPLVEGTDYEINADGGTLNRIAGGATNWAEPVVVNYTGGFDLPNDAPSPLKQAAILLTRESYYAATRGDATVRMISHKDARVIYFDPNVKASGGKAGGPATPARRAIDALLSCYTRYEV